MADNVINNLAIEVTASAENATKVFDRLASSAGRVRGAANSASGGLQNMATGAKDAGMATAEAGEASGSATPRIRGVGNAAHDAGEKAKKGAHGLANFWQSLKRIAYYRFIRAVIREIGEAIKTGIGNLYQWSTAVNGTFAKSMDRIATSTLYLKNSLGAMFAPIINTLAPIIDWVIDRIVDVINWINKLFAALSGSQTYTVAKKVATTWGDAGKQAAGSAKSAADDIRRTILGFDEINKLEKQNTSSGGSGRGSSTPGTDYTNMFEERRLDGWMSKLASFIDRFKAGWIGVLGGILAGWASIKAAISAVTKLSLGWLKDMSGKVINVAVSLVRKGWTTIKAWAVSFGAAVVDIYAKIKTKANDLKEAIVRGFNNLPSWALGVAVSIATTAIELKKEIAGVLSSIGSWSLGVVLKIVSKAQDLWDKFRQGWNAIPDRVAQFGIMIGTNIQALWGWLVEQWGIVSRGALNIFVRIATKIKDIWDDFKSAWSRGTEKVVSFGVKIGTKLSDLWDWLKENWEYVALGALGIAIAIATPWETLAAALSSLWGNVMASFGGALSFAVAPVLSLFPTKSELDSRMGVGHATKEELVSSQAVYDTWQGHNGITRGDTWMNTVSGPVTGGTATKAGSVDRSYYNTIKSLNANLVKDVKTTAQQIKKQYTGSGGITETATNSSKNVVNTVANGVGKVSSSIIAANQSINDDTAQATNQLNNTVGASVKIINGKLDDATLDLLRTVTSTNKNINSDTSQTFGKIQSTVVSSATTSSQSVDDMANSMTGSMNRANRGVSGSIYGIGSTLSNESSTISWVVSEAFGGIANTIVNCVVNARNSASRVSFYEIGANIVNGIYNGIQNSWNWLNNTVSNLANGLFNGVKRIFRIGSPSKLFRDEVGKMIVLGWAEGITESAPVAMKSISDFSDSLKDQLSRSSMVPAMNAVAVNAYNAVPEYGDVMNVLNANVSGNNGGNEVDPAIALLESLLAEMRQFNEKEFTAEVTTSSIVRGMTRTNRRAGTTVVSVGG